MGKKPKYRMSIQERAKQFMPFSALTGFDLAIKKVEEEYYRTHRITLSETEREQLDYCLKKLTIGDDITIKYYKNEEYQYLTGKLLKVDDLDNTLKIGQEIVKIEDIIEIDLEEQDYA